MTKVIITVILLFFLTNAVAQSIQYQHAAPNVIPPSPDVASLGKYADIPVDLYTGVPQVAIPIFTLKSLETEIPISINYHASGIKVDEVASNVGLGWSLNAGGVISVSVMGHPDLNASFQRVPFPEELITDINGDGINEFTSQYHTYFQSVTSGVIDSEPDVYYYNFPGKSGKFVFDHTGNIKTIPYQAIQIQQDPTTRIFTLVDEKGWTFTFIPGESVTVQSRLLQRGSLPISYTPPPVVNEISAYVLAKVRSPGNDSIIFEYESYGYSYKSAMHESDYTLVSGQQLCTQSDAPLQELWERVNHVSSLRPKKITSATGTTVIFSYGSTPRLDVKTPPAGNSNSSLTEVAITNLFHDTIARWRFEYDYFRSAQYDFIAEQERNLHCKLKLRSVSELGKSPFEFTYFETTNFPERFSFSQDHWGYYNERPTAGSSLPRIAYAGTIINGSDRSPNPIAMKVGSLKSIRYPTGGKTEFDFESHDYAAIDNVYDWPQPVTHGVGISVSADPDAATLETTSFVIPANALRCSSSDPDKIRVLVSMNNATGSQFQSPGIAGLAFASITGPDNFQLVSSGMASYEICVPPGHYTGRATAQGHYDPNSTDVPAWANLTFTWYLPTTATATLTNIGIGGLRVKKVTDIGIDGRVTKVQKYSYLKPNTHESSGILANPPRVGYQAEVTKTIRQDDMTVPVTCQFYVRESQTSVPLGLIKGSNVAYEYVTVSEGENAENGKVIYQYSSFRNIAPEKTYPIVPSVDNDWIRGLLIKKMVFKKIDTSFVEVEREERSYRIFHDPFLFWQYRTPTLNPVIVDSGESSMVDDGSPYPITTLPPGYNLESNILCLKAEKAVEFTESTFTMTLYNYNYYKYTSAYYHLFQITKTHNDLNGVPHATEERYYFDNYRHLLPTRVATSFPNGSVQLTINRYPWDYHITSQGVSDPFVSAIMELQSTNQINTLVESQVWNKKGAWFNLKSSKLNEYVKTPNGVKVTAQFSLPGRANLAFVNSGITSDNAFYKSDNYIRDIDYRHYSDNGLVSDYQLRTGEWVSLVYGYNNSLPIARILSSSSRNVFHTSFEDIREGASTEGDAKAGRLSKLNGFSKTLSGLTDGLYYLSYWRKTDERWRLINETVNVNSGTYTINLTGQVDEVRFLPESARIETWTHQPEVGITSSCDSNNRYSFYRYDSVGRLQSVIDHDGNILKSFHYNYYKP